MSRGGGTVSLQIGEEILVGVVSHDEQLVCVKGKRLPRTAGANCGCNTSSDGADVESAVLYMVSVETVLLWEMGVSGVGSWNGEGDVEVGAESAS
jgi:hypothetical protein